MAYVIAWISDASVEVTKGCMCICVFIFFGGWKETHLNIHTCLVLCTDVWNNISTISIVEGIIRQANRQTQAGKAPFDAPVMLDKIGVECHMKGMSSIFSYSILNIVRKIRFVETSFVLWEFRLLWFATMGNNHLEQLSFLYSNSRVHIASTAIYISKGSTINFSNLN